MRTIVLLTFALITACVKPGYYDNKGNWVQAPAPSSMQRDKLHNPEYPFRPNDNSNPSRASYNSIPGVGIQEAQMDVPPSMYPPANMCRIWLSDRSVDQQPEVEPCDGIQSRAPAGAYIIYGNHNG